MKVKLNNELRIMNIKSKYRYYYIYLTKNIVNNKKYIGWHATNKLYDGYIGSGHYLQRSINKYGKNNFLNGIIEFCDENNFLQREKYWIKELNTMTPNGYNLTEGGEGAIGYKHTLENLKLFKKRRFSEESKRKMSLSHKGKKINHKVIHSQETREKISKTLSDKNIEKNIEILNLYKNGKTYKEIMFMTGCCGKTISKILRKNNLRGRNWADYNDHKLKQETKDKLSSINLKKSENTWESIKELYMKGFTTREIVKKLHTSPNTVTKVIKKFKLRQ
jgi:group I intron endonuclease